MAAAMGMTNLPSEAMKMPMTSSRNEVQDVSQDT